MYYIIGLKLDKFKSRWRMWVDQAAHRPDFGGRQMPSRDIFDGRHERNSPSREQQVPCWHRSQDRNQGNLPLSTPPSRLSPSRLPPPMLPPPPPRPLELSLLAQLRSPKPASPSLHTSYQPALQPMAPFGLLSQACHGTDGDLLSQPELRKLSKLSLRDEGSGLPRTEVPALHAIRLPPPLVPERLHEPQIVMCPRSIRRGLDAARGSNMIRAGSSAQPPPMYGTLDAVEGNGVRVFVSFIAVALLWATQLRVVVALLSGPQPLVPTPAWALVLRELSMLSTETHAQHDGYGRCVAEAISRCNRTLAAAEAAELWRTNAAHVANKARIAEATRAHQACDATLRDVRASLEVWRQRRSLAAQAAVLLKCSHDERRALQELTGEPMGSESAPATLGLLENFAASSKRVVAHLSEALVERAEYDRSYLHNKTLALQAVAPFRAKALLNVSRAWHLRLHSINTSIARVVNCATLRPSIAAAGSIDGLLCSPGQSVRAVLDSALDQMEAAAAAAATDYSLAVTQAKSYSEHAVETVAAVSGTLRAVVAWWDEHLPELHFGESTGISMDLLGELELGKLTLDPMAVLPLVAPDLNALHKTVVATVDDTERRLRAATAAVDASVGALLKKLESGFPMSSAFADYDPPRQNGNALARQHTAQAAAFRRAGAEAIRVLQISAVSPQRPPQSPELSSSEVRARGASGAPRDLSWFVQRNLEPPELILLEWVMRRLDWLGNASLHFDSALRVLYTLALVRRFWGRSSLPVRAVDMSTDTHARARARPALATARRLAVALAQPLTRWVLGALFGALAISQVWSVYAPILAHFKEGCHELGHGTGLGRAAYAVAFNAASLSGHKARLIGLERHEATRRAVCVRYSEDSTASHALHQRTLRELLSELRTRGSEMALLRRCYNSTLLSSEFDALGLLAEGHQLFEATLADSRCTQLFDIAHFEEHVEVGVVEGTITSAATDTAAAATPSFGATKPLERGVFECERLPDCEVRCDELSGESGIDVSGLRERSAQAACTFEWWLHAHLMRATAAAAVFGLVNLFRILVVAGLVRLLWPSLTAGGLFAFEGTADVLGSARHSRVALAAEIRAMLHRLRKIGACLIVLALLLQLPWLWLVMHVLPGLVLERR